MRIAGICVLAITLIAGGEATAASSQYGTVDYGIDRPGHDIHHFELNPALYQGEFQCEDACERNPACRAWTFVKANSFTSGPNAGGKSHCWLKGRVPDPVPNNCCISGVHQKRLKQDFIHR